MNPLQVFHSLQPSVLASLSFVYVYLPACLLVWYLAPKKLRSPGFLLTSIVFYAFAAPGYLVLTLASAFCDCFLTLGLCSTRRPLRRRLILALCVLKNLFLIAYFGIMAQLAALSIPLGLVVVCVSGIDAALSVYRESEPAPRPFIGLALYILYFPRLYSGPVCTPGCFDAEIDGAAFDPGKIIQGFERFTHGLFKHAVLGYGLFLLYQSVLSIPTSQDSVLSAWALVVFFSLSLYFTLCGMSDMARGVSLMMGVTLPKSFNYPFEADSVTDFYGRFNITAGDFLNRAVAKPLSPGKNDHVADALNMILVGMLWGLWHGARTNYLIWGALIAALMLLEKYLYPKVLAAMPMPARRVYALAAVLFGFAVFSADTFTHGLALFARMFSFSGEAFPLFGENDQILFVLSSNWILILASAAFATSAAHRLRALVGGLWPRPARALSLLLDSCVLLASTAFLLGGSRP